MQEMKETQVWSLGWEDPLEEEIATSWSSSILHLGNPMDWEAWWATVHGVTKSWTQPSTHTQEEVKVAKGRISLVVYWIGLHTSNEEGEGLIPG